jgi:FAD/FMN-containing dehydrogenase
MAAVGMVQELAEFVGKENVKTGAAALAGYFADPVESTGLVLVKPADEYELAEVADAANRAKVSLFSVRREKMDNSLASRDGLLLDLSRMDAIKELDRRNLMGHIFAGVTFEKLRQELLKMDCKVLMPANATSRSVLRSYLDRDILNGNAVYRFPNLSIFHAILSDGRIWVSGSQQMTNEGIADFREDQGPQFSLFFGASEDIFGIPFYGIVYIYPIREKRRVLLFGFDDLEPAAQLAYKFNRDEHCFECVTANSRYLSVLLGKDTGAADALREKLPAWTTAVSIEHHTELVDLWEKYIRADAESFGARELDGELPQMMDEKFQQPWYIFDRDYLRGHTSCIQHYDYYRRAPGLLAAVGDAAQSKGYAADEVGQVIIPVYFGASCYCESDLYFDPADGAERAKAADISRNAYGKLLDEGSFVDRPTGEAAEMVFDRVSEGYLKILKTFKNVIDPAGLMNPEQLLEGV